MRRIATLTFLLALAGTLLAGGPDDDYLVIYSQIQQADTMQKSGQLREAATEYLHARDALQKLHADFPNSNAAAVNYRLDYLADKLKELAAYLPSGSANPAPAKPATTLTPQQQAQMWQEEVSALTNATAQLEIQTNALRQKINELTSANSQLQSKLREALAEQPAAVAPAEMAKLQAQLLALQKDRDLLRATLDQLKASKPAPKPSAANTESATPPAEIADIMYNFNMPVQKVMDEVYAPLVNRTAIYAATGPAAIERGALITLHTPSPLTKSDAIKALEAALAVNGMVVVPVGDKFFNVVPDKKVLEANIRRDDANSVAASKLKTAEKERDDLKKELDSANRKADASSAEAASKLKSAEKERDDLKKQIAAIKPGAPAPRTAAASGSSTELEGLRARLAVLEAAKVPYTTEELALLKNSPSAAAVAPPLAAKQPSSKVHSVKDLSASLRAIMLQAGRDAESKHYTEAEKAYQDVLRQDENNIDVMYYLGHVQFVAGQMDDCDKTVHRALALNANDPGNLYLLGILRYGQEKLDEALDALSRSAAINSTNSATQCSLGSVLAAKGLRGEAETAFRKALEIDPNYGDAHFNLALIYATEKPPLMALAHWHYQKAIDNGHEKSDKLEKMMTDAK